MEYRPNFPHQAQRPEVMYQNNGQNISVLADIASTSYPQHLPSAPSNVDLRQNPEQDLMLSLQGFDSMAASTSDPQPDPLSNQLEDGNVEFVEYYEDSDEELWNEMSLNREGKSQIPDQPYVVSINQKGLFACWVCFQKFSLCLHVKMHILRQHEHALCAVAQTETDYPHLQHQLLLFCPKRCLFVTSKLNAFCHHLATCRESESRNAGQDFVTIHNNFISLDYHKLQQQVASGSFFDRIRHLNVWHVVRKETLPHPVDSSQISPAGQKETDNSCDFKKESDEESQDDGSDEDTGIPNPPRKRRIAKRNPKRRQALITNKKLTKKIEMTSLNSEKSTDSSDFEEIGPDITHRPYTYMQVQPANVYSDSSSDGDAKQGRLSELKFKIVPKVKKDIRFSHGPYKCHNCEKVFMSKSGLRRHLRRKHTLEKSFRFECHECEKVFITNSGLRRHLLRKHSLDEGFNFKCKDCGKFFIQNLDYQIHMNRFKAESFNCGECHKTFDRRCVLRAHMQMHKDGNLYKCGDCGMSFPHRGDLQAHLKKHPGDRPFTCGECGKSYSRGDTLNAHMKAHAKEKPVTCEECGKKFSQKEFLEAHMITHTGEKPFKCDECDEGFIQLSHLQLHQETHAIERPFKCTQCGKRFRQNRGLEEHMKQHEVTPSKCDKCDDTFNCVCELHVHKFTHRGRKPYICDECLDSSGEPAEEDIGDDVVECNKSLEITGDRPQRSMTKEEEGFKCSKCGRSVRLKCHIPDHIERAKEYNCNQCDGIYNSLKALSKHKQRVHTGESRFGCNRCDRRFDLRRDLLRHVVTHQSEIPFECKECGKRFNRSSDLKTHMSLKLHTGEKPFECVECGKIFKQSSLYHMHMRMHSGQKPFPCDYCGKHFKWISDLRVHTRTHTGEKPFQCGDCGKRFSRLNNLHNHARAHKGLYKNVCEICGKGFFQKCGLDRHRTTHENKRIFQCDKCGKSFKWIHDLYRHERTHTGDKPFRCKDCGKLFGRTDDLRSHKKIHTGENSYYCEECGKSFSLEKGLERHMKKHEDQQSL